MIDVNKLKADAESEVREEKVKTAKEKIKALLRKKDQAQTVVNNIEREIADCYAEIGQGSVT